MKSSFLLGLWLLAPLPAFACISFAPQPSEAARGTILVGYVTAEEYPDWEAALIKKGTTQHSLFGRRVVRVTFVQALKGELIGPLEAETPCYASVPQIGERAIVVRLNGSDHVAPATPEYEAALRAAVAEAHGR